MPELPEVKTVVSQLNTLIINHIIKDILIYKPKIIKEISAEEFKKQLIGKKIKNITNKGKFIIFHLNDDLFLVTHMRMEGKYFFYDKKTKPIKHVHLIFQFDNGSELQYHDTRIFGTFQIRNKNYLEELPLSKLGNEAAHSDPNLLFEKIKNRRIAIKTILLDQTFMVGLGNIYVDEVLFDVKINPKTPANKITYDEMKKIINSTHKILTKATKCGGSSIASYTSLNGKKGTYQNHLKVHTRKDKPCVICSLPISKIKVNGRGTYYCKRCQK